MGVDTSDPFAIEVVKLGAPNGDESLKSGDPYTILWQMNGTKNPVASVELHYTLDGGQNWKFIARPSPDLRSQPWILPMVKKPKNNCKVRIVLKDKTGTTLGSDTSDDVFTISP